MREFPIVTRHIQEGFEAQEIARGNSDKTPQICGFYGRACRQMNKEDGANNIACLSCPLARYATEIEELVADVHSAQVWEDTVVYPAKSLPMGWLWVNYSDGSGHLESPSHESLFSYDLSFYPNTVEYKEDSCGEWRPAFAGSFDKFREFAESKVQAHLYNDIVKLHTWMHYEYEDCRWPLVFVQLKLSSEQVKNVLAVLDTLYGDTDQETTEWALEFQVLTRMLCHHTALIANPKYLDAQDMLDELAGFLGYEAAAQYRQFCGMSIEKARAIHESLQ